MSPIVAGIVGIVVMLVFMALRMPIAIAMAIPGFLGALYVMGAKPAFTGLATIPYGHAHSYVLSTIPMFVLMGELIYYSGISGEIFATLQKWVGYLKGGVAMATIAACAVFAAGCGSSVAAAATMGSVALPEMEKLNYDRKLATGTIAAGGTLGILIPPSTGFILYGILTEQSIGKLFIAGILPGIILAILFILTIYLRARLNPELAPSSMKVVWRERFVALKSLVSILILFVLVIGGLYIGIFTPTEAAGVGAFGALVIGLARRKLSWQAFFNALRDTLRTSCMIFAIIIGAMIFNYFLAVTRVPIAIGDFVTALPLPPLYIAAIILLVYIVLGCFMDALAMIIITIPIFYPTIQAMGFDPIWFGVMLVIMIEMAMITPPVGMNCYVLSGIARHIPLEDIFRGIAIFIIPMVIMIVILMFFPQVALFLPGTMQ